ncbi:MAG TPA: 6-pyruvoyl tetrahydropterin synthase family protein [Euryarchaeota archaeon]|nr:6-pyruvoyl tetrahydropterin synthase family protein [Euryarchaeota archaeon]
MQMELDGWRLRLIFSAAHVMIGHAKCGRLHGHDYAISVRLEGEPGPDGVIMDFGLIKDIVRGITEELDHKFLVGVNNENVSIKGDVVSVRSGESMYQIPIRDCATLEIEQTTAEEISKWFSKRLRDQLSRFENIESLSVKVEEGVGQGIWHSVDL